MFGFGIIVDFLVVLGVLGENGNGGMVIGCVEILGCVVYIGISFFD